MRARATDIERHTTCPDDAGGRRRAAEIRARTTTPSRGGSATQTHWKNGTGTIRRNVEDHLMSVTSLLDTGGG